MSYDANLIGIFCLYSMFPHVFTSILAILNPNCKFFLQFLTIYDLAIYDDHPVPINRKKRGTNVLRQKLSILYSSTLSIFVIVS